jgi:hypothetical protein
LETAGESEGKKTQFVPSAEKPRKSQKEKSPFDKRGKEGDLFP